MSESEIGDSDIFLKQEIVFEKPGRYLIRAQSGKGKSSVLNFIYGSNLHYDGQISYSADFELRDPVDLKQTKLSYAFQDFKLFPGLTLTENIELKNKLTHYRSREEIDGMVERVNLGHRRDSLVQKLSIGQRQRVAILRALCQPFSFLLLDEPFSHLDNENIRIMTSLIDEELKKQQAGLILTSLESSYYFDYDKILNL
ncbi:MAG: ATP-binding cassette domain-containing protein [Bacteroidales bacterium]|nr:ATP-binding cassette domain-containing protein [Bacteroidales bacterium]